MSVEDHRSGSLTRSLQNETVPLLRWHSPSSLACNSLANQTPDIGASGIYQTGSGSKIKEILLLGIQFYRGISMCEVCYR